LSTLCAFSILMLFSKIRSRKPGPTPASPAAHLQCSTARVWRDRSAVSFCSCKLLWGRDECVSLPCFNAQPDISVVMNCCVVAFSLFSSDSLIWSADSLYSVHMTHEVRGVDVEKYALLCQQTSPKRWFGNMEMTSNCDVTNSTPNTNDYHMTLNQPPPMKIFCVRHWSHLCCLYLR